MRIRVHIRHVRRYRFQHRAVQAGNAQQGDPIIAPVLSDRLANGHHLVNARHGPQQCLERRMAQQRHAACAQFAQQGHVAAQQQHIAHARFRADQQRFAGQRLALPAREAKIAAKRGRLRPRFQHVPAFRQAALAQQQVGEIVARVRVGGIEFHGPAVAVLCLCFALQAGLQRAQVGPGRRQLGRQRQHAALDFLRFVNAAHPQ